MAQTPGPALRLAIGAFVSATVMWIIAGFWHNDLGPGVVNGELAHLGAGSLGLTFLAYAILAGIMARVYLAVSERRRTLWTAIRIGMYAGIIWTFPHALLTAAGLGEPLAPIFQHTLYHIFEEGIGGLVLGLAYHVKAQAPA